MKSRLIFAAVAAAVSAAARVGDLLGTNIHWRSETTPGEAAQLARAFKVARMDFTWGGIESTCGQYNFSAYDVLLATMKAHSIKPYWILDYSNPCYPPSAGSKGNACNTAACIAAYGRFAAAAVAHFKGNGIIWETVNEPNGMGGDNATDITALALAAAPAMAAAAETFVGPTTAGIDVPYLNATFAAGILKAFTAVSVHPYRSSAPETVVADYVQLREMIAQWAPPGKSDMPIYAGEWGYTSALPPCIYGNRVDVLTQGKYAARMWLNNLRAGVLLSIAYDWRDDSTNVTDCESNFGSVEVPSTGNASMPFRPKPFYNAAYTLQNTVGDAEAFSGEIAPSAIGPASPSGAAPVTARDVHVMAFTGYQRPGGGGNGVAIAAWTNATQCVTPQPTGRRDCGYNGIDYNTCTVLRGCCWDPSSKPNGPQCYTGLALTAPLSVTVPLTTAATPGVAQNACFSTVDFQGNSTGSVCAAGGVITLSLTDGPTYLT